MENFSKALLCADTILIPNQFDWFAPLLGDWDCDYYDEPAEGQKRHVRGEWIFRRILEGAGVQDVFIFPSRETREASPQPDGEYGTALRIFNSSKGCYDAVYTCAGCMKRLTFTMEAGRLVGRVHEEKDTFWAFSDMTGNSFHWENYQLKEDGTKQLACEIFGKRKPAKND